MAKLPAGPARKLRGAVACLPYVRDVEVLVEGRAGTGKSIGIQSYIHQLCRTHAGIRVLFARDKRVDCTESTLVTFETKVLGENHPMVLNGPTRAGRHAYHYANGSTIVVGGLDRPAKLFSTEWDVVYINEATEVTLEQWELFGRALRNNKLVDPATGKPWHMLIGDCNPTFPGHWLNMRATPAGDRLRRVRSWQDYERLQAYNLAGANGSHTRRLISVHQDNPFYFDLEQWQWEPAGLSYLAVLSNMSGSRLKRMRDGLWVAAEGTVYPEFDISRHVVQPFPIPPHWPQFVGYDPGYDHPTAILWFAVAPTGVVYVCCEHYRGGLAIPEHAQAVRRLNAGRTVRRYYADPQEAFSQRAGDPLSIASQWKKQGFAFSPWPRSTDVQTMVERVRTFLREDRLKVFGDCQNTIREFQSWRYKRDTKGRMPQGDDQFEDANNDAMDVVKGVLAAGIAEARDGEGVRVQRPPDAPEGGKVASKRRRRADEVLRRMIAAG